jgi:uncharacterized protein (TIGR03083 family)
MIMAMTPDIWSSVAELRLRVASTLRTLPPAQCDSPSWCAGWRVRDVCGHLVHLAESTQASMIRDVISNGVAPDPALNRIATRLGERPVPELADRLEAAATGRFHVLGTQPAVALGEVIVHSADMFRPLSIAFDVDPDVVVPVFPTYRRLRRLAFHGKSLGAVQLAATDTDWQSGTGPQIRGRAVDLLLFLANRSEVTPSLSGPGLAGPV